MQRASLAGNVNRSSLLPQEQQMMMGNMVGLAPTQLQNLANQQHQMNLNANPNLNEVMCLDPTDGRDTRGRGASRDASNSRIVTLQGSSSGYNVNQGMRNMQQLGPVAMRPGA